MDTRSDLLNALRRYSASRTDIEREIRLVGDPSSLYASQSLNVFADSGDVDAAERELLRAPHADDQYVIEAKVYLSLIQHDCKSALAVLSPSYLRGPSPIATNMRFQFAGETQILCGEKQQGVAKLERALTNWDRFLARNPRMVLAHSYRARCLAYLGRKNDALHETRSWAELSGADRWARLGDYAEVAAIYAVCGDSGAAINALEQLSQQPTLFLSAQELRRHPKWAALRTNPRFPKLLADWKPL